MLEAKNIKKSFGALEVLRGVDLNINKGDVTSILGPSGSGKSTFLRCINMLEKVNYGSLQIDGECLFNIDDDSHYYADKKEMSRLKSKLGMVFQNFNLFPHLSVLENLMLAPTVAKGIGKDQAESIARELLSKVGLTFKADNYPYQLSGGQQQRVAIARALALNPEILCFDEPTSSLDPELTVEVLNVIKSLAAENMTMIIVTHEMGFAREVSDHVVFMDDGLIVEQGKPLDVIDHAKSERAQAFFGKMLR